MKDQLQQILGIDLIKFVFSKGYTEKIASKSTRKWLVLKNPNSGDKIMLTDKGYNGFPFYKNLDESLSLDKGNIINFTINRLDNQVAPVVNPSKETRSKAFRELKNYIGVLEPNTTTPFKISKEVKPADDVRSKIRQLQDRSEVTEKYLKSKRNIDPSTLNSPLFAGSIKEAPVPLTNGKVILNTSFVKRDIDNTIIGYTTHYYSSKEERNRKRVYQLKDGIFRSNIFPNSTTLLYGESAIDCLSHYQLNKNKDVVYASTGGQLSNTKVEELHTLFNKLYPQYRKLFSITDNDRSGHLLDLNLAIEFFNIDNPDKPIEQVQHQSYNKFLFHWPENESMNQQWFNDFNTKFQNEAKSQGEKLLMNMTFVALKGARVLEIPKTSAFRFYDVLTSLIHKENNISYTSKKTPIASNKTNQKKDWNEILNPLKKKSTKGISR